MTADIVDVLTHHGAAFGACRHLKRDLTGIRAAAAVHETEVQCFVGRETMKLTNEEVGRPLCCYRGRSLGEKEEINPLASCVLVVRLAVGLAGFVTVGECDSCECASEESFHSEWFSVLNLFAIFFRPLPFIWQILKLSEML